jgi:hypothetical protein
MLRPEQSGVVISLTKPAEANEILAGYVNGGYTPGQSFIQNREE